VATGKVVGIDMGLNAYYTDSEGNTVDNPRYLRKAEKRLKRLSRKHSKCTKKSHNRKKAQKKLAKAHVKVQRQREDFARKQANALITSSDMIAYEKLSIRNMVKNHHLAKSISDAAWGVFLRWVSYYGTVQNIPVVAVAPHFTSQDCSACGTRVKKSLSVRAHVCHGCGLVLDRDHNAALNIRDKGLMVLSGRQEPTGHAARETLLDRSASTHVPQGAWASHLVERRIPRLLKRGSVKEISLKSMQGDFGTFLLKGIFAGWLIALMVWLLPAADATRLHIIIILTYIVGVGEFAHIIVDSVNVAYLLNTGLTSWSSALGMLLPTLLGNILGGVSLVAVLNFGQIAGEQNKKKAK